MRLFIGGMVQFEMISVHPRRPLHPPETVAARHSRDGADATVTASWSGVCRSLYGGLYGDLQANLRALGVLCKVLYMVVC